MKGLFRPCEHCNSNPGTVSCNSCSKRFCYDCDSQIHKEDSSHKKDILSLSQIKNLSYSSNKYANQSSIIYQQQGPKDSYLHLHQNKSLLQTQQYQEELKNLDIELRKQTQIKDLQENKWKKQIEVLEREYQSKIGQFEIEVEKSEKCLTELKQQSESEGQIEEMMAELKKQLEGQKSQLLSQVTQQKQQLQDKEKLLQQLIQQEKEFSGEINKKELLISKFKELIQQQQQEKELIVSENEKIKKQLIEIKNLFKEKLPSLGLDENFFNFDDEDEQEGQEAEDEEQQQVGQNQDQSTDEEEPR